MIYQIQDRQLIPIWLNGHGVRKMLLRDQSIAPWQNHKWAAFLTSRAGEHFLAYYGSQQEARTAAQKALGRPPYLAAYKPPQTPSKGPAT